MIDDSHPVQLNRSELEFIIFRGFQQIRRGLWRDSRVNDEQKVDRSYEAMTRVMLARFDDLKVYKRPPSGPAFDAALPKRD